MNFIDEARVVVRAGRGGDGCVAFRREKFVPKGGPAGGDGGSGGSVVLVGDESLNTLYPLRFSPTLAADRGRHGEGSCRTGRSADDLLVRVPLGTVVYDADEERVLGEILQPDQHLVVAKGGRGGRGNAFFVGPTRQAPRFAQPGEEGEERPLRLELKLLADVGLVGLPNAGKSTLISSVSAARPKIADYPFTTLVPQLGVVAARGGEEPFVIADLPGLIAGAAQGAGLGLRFLRHVERCRVLVFLVDLSAFEDDAVADLRAVESELEAYRQDLLDRERLIVGSKVDAARPQRRDPLRQAAADSGLPYLEVSAVTRQGLSTLVEEIAKLLEAATC